MMGKGGRARLRPRKGERRSFRRTLQPTTTRRPLPRARAQVIDLCAMPPADEADMAWGPVGAVGTVSVAFEPGQSIITLTGEIDVALGLELREACKAVVDRGMPVCVQATAMTFIDSVGAGRRFHSSRAGQAGAGQPLPVLQRSS
jgi:hypothetical protein